MSELYYIYRDNYSEDVRYTTWNAESVYESWLLEIETGSDDYVDNLTLGVL